MFPIPVSGSWPHMRPRFKDSTQQARLLPRNRLILAPEVPIAFGRPYDLNDLVGSSFQVQRVIEDAVYVEACV